MPLPYQETHPSLNIANGATVLTYAHSGSATVIALCRIKLGSNAKPIAGSATYVIQASVNGVAVSPDSLATVEAVTQTYMQSREIMLRPGDIIDILVDGPPGDVDVETLAVLTDVTPLTQEDVFGAGTVPVDHNYGGADALRVTNPGGGGIDDVSILAYLTADYNVGNRSLDFLKGRSTTGVDGRWLTPLMLAPAAYTLVLSKPKEYQTRTQAITVS